MTTTYCLGAFAARVAGIKPGKGAKAPAAARTAIEREWKALPAECPREAGACTPGGCRRNCHAYAKGEVLRMTGST